MTYAELDSHADTCVFGREAYIIRDTDQTVDVAPFDEALGSVKEVPIVTAAIAYDDPNEYRTYILFFHQSLYIPSLDQHLICPEQCRQNQVTVNETPLLHLPFDIREPFHHSIITTDPDLHIPLELNGVISGFPCRKPTKSEVTNESDVTHIHLTSSNPWDPMDASSGDQEQAIRTALGDEPAEPRNRQVRALMTIDQNISRPSAALDTDCWITEVFAMKTKHRKGRITAEQLAARWKIGVETARRTLDATTQLAVRDFSHSTMGRRLKPYAYQLKYPRLNCTMYTDTMFGRVRSLDGNLCAQVYCTPFHWVYVEPMATERDAHKTLDSLFRYCGVPQIMVSDNAKALTQGEFRAKIQRAQATPKSVEAFTSNQCLAEDIIRELKNHYRRNMEYTPEQLWDRCFVFTAKIRAHSALAIRELNGDVPTTLLTGDTADISHLAEFGWYQWVWYLSPEDSSMNTKSLGRYVGPSHDVGEALCAAVLTDKAKIVSRTSVFPLTVAEDCNDEIQIQKRKFTLSVKERIGKKYEIVDEDDSDEATPQHELYEPVVEDKPLKAKDDPEGNHTPNPMQELEEADEMQHEAFDNYVSAKVCIKQGDEMSYGTVKRRKRDADGNLMGTSHNNPFIDTSLYEVEFESGETEAYTANLIAEAIYAKIDDEGYTHMMMDEIVDHKVDHSAVKHGDSFVTHNGREHRRRTTKGWKLCVKWKDNSTTWETLKDMKDSDPLATAEYAVNNKLVEHPAFAWWVPHVIRKKDRIIKAAKARHFRTNQKYGIEIPKTVERAMELDKENGNTLWRDSLRKEMKAVAKAFEVLPEGAPPPVGHTKIGCHIIWDVKADFTRKARYVAEGYRTDPPAALCYASVVSRESVRLAFLIAALNDLDVLAADLGNAFINSPCAKKIYIKCGPEWGPEMNGRLAKVVRALYGLKSSGAAWRAHLAEILHDNLGFKPCRADNDVWLRQALKPNGEKYYEYVLVYTDDILAVSLQPDKILCYLDQHFLVKPGSLGKPTQYLGSSVSRFKIPQDDTECWAMGSEQYVKEAVRNVKTWLEKRGLNLKSKAPSVLPSSYRPECDATAMCNDADHSYYLQQIGVLRWAVELGRIDICTEVSMLSSYSAAPRVGHLDAVMHLFAYLNSHERSKVVFDPAYFNHKQVTSPDWTEFYKDAKEPIPHDQPEPLVKPIQMTCFVDSDHAGDTVTRRSRTGVLIFCNRAPITWLSRKQASIETSSFGSEFTAMKVATEILEGLRYKLRMMGVPLDGPAHVKADNQSVIVNTSKPESTLKKKSNSIAYHYVRERVAQGAIEISYEPTKSNLADMLTKIQPGTVRSGLVKCVLF